ncbi:MAG: hypothetical protein LUQ01_02820 [Methanolinea sp.]|nr:hypothetical protein [Methanolinea sp.]
MIIFIGALCGESCLRFTELSFPRTARTLLDGTVYLKHHRLPGDSSEELGGVFFPTPMI